jgi:hypothetical protein
MTHVGTLKNLSDDRLREEVSKSVWDSDWFKSLVGTATGVHIDETEAANILVACLCYASLSDAARHVLPFAPLALWCLFRREDVLAVQTYLAEKDHSLFVASYLFTTEDFKNLALRGIHPHWVFQRIGDTVFIAGMVAHAVYNIISCLKFAGDSISANHLAVTMTKIRVQALVEKRLYFAHRVPHMHYTGGGQVRPPDGNKLGAFLVDPVLLSLYNLKTLLSRYYLSLARSRSL